MPMAKTNSRSMDPSLLSADKPRSRPGDAQRHRRAGVLWAVRGPPHPGKTPERAVAQGFLVELTVPLMELQLLKALDLPPSLGKACSGA
jgi:hypothetical protein